MNLIVAGCGRLGSELAYRLFQLDHRVTIIDNNSASFERLNPGFRGRTIEGDLFSKEVLERAGIEKADGLAAVTNSDSHNAVIAHIAHIIYRVPNVVVRNYDPKLRSVLEAFGFQIVSSTSWGAQRIEEMLSGLPVHTVFSAGNGEVEIYEFSISNSWDGRPLSELLGDSESCIPVALIRAGRSALPTPDTVLKAGDLIDISATAKSITKLRERLKKEET